MWLIKNGSTPEVNFKLANASTLAPALGLTVANIVTAIKKPGGSWTDTTNACTEVGRGWYEVSLTATETNTDGQLIFGAFYSTDGTFANRDTTYTEWDDNTLQVYSTVYVTTDTGVTVAATLDANERNDIADFVLRRDLTTAEASTTTDIDTLTGLSLLGVLARFAYKIESNAPTTPGTITVYRSDNSTSFYTQAVPSVVSGTSDPNALDKVSDS